MHYQFAFVVRAKISKFCEKRFDVVTLLSEMAPEFLVLYVWNISLIRGLGRDIAHGLVRPPWDEQCLVCWKLMDDT